MKTVSTARAIAVLSLKFTVEVSRMGEATKRAEDRMHRNLKRSPDGRNSSRSGCSCEKSEVD